MKPIQYFVQNETIDALTERYGQHFKDMFRDDRNAVIAVLALYYAQCRAWPGTNPPEIYDMSNYMNPDTDRTSDDFEWVCEQLDELTVSECHSLLHALTQQEIERV